MPLSYSQLRRYRTCPRQFEFSNVKKIPWGISEGESFGASVHVALKKWGELELGIGEGLGKKRKKNEQVREDQIPLFVEGEAHVLAQLTEEKLIEIWHRCFVFDTYPTRFEAEFARQRGDALLRKFYAWWAKAPRKVIAVEKSFSLEIDSLVVAGRLDRVEVGEGGVHILDYKTGQPCSQQEADADLQLSLYALAAEQLFEQPFDSAQGKPCTALTLLFLSEEGVLERSTARSPSQLKDARTQIKLIRERMDALDFRPTPSVSACKRCPYRGVCDVAAV